MASLGISNDEIRRNIATLIGIDRDPAQWSPTDSDDVSRIIRSGRRKAFSANDWSFLEHTILISVLPPQNTGTVTIVNGVVTLTGATFPTNSAHQRLGVASSVYEIATFDSPTQVTLLDTSVNVAAGTAYVLYFTRYSLPTNFAAFVSPVTIENQRDFIELRELAVLPEFNVRGFNSRQTVLSRRPEAFAIYQSLDTASAVETGTPTYHLDLYPLPDKSYTVNAVVRINPGDALAELGEVFHPSFSELMQEAILSAAEVIYNNEAGIHTQMYDAILPDYIRKDMIAKGTRRLRPRDDGRSNRNFRYLDLINGVVRVDTGV